MQNGAEKNLGFAESHARKPNFSPVCAFEPMKQFS